MQTQYQNDDLWINHEELNKAEFLEIKTALFGKDMLFDRLSIDQSKIHSVHQYEWVIEDDEYKHLESMAVSEHLDSPQFRYEVSEESTISFHFTLFGRFCPSNVQK